MGIHPSLQLGSGGFQSESMQAPPSPVPTVSELEHGLGNSPSSGQEAKKIEHGKETPSSSDRAVLEPLCT